MVINRNPEYFLTIVEKSSISRAAEILYISQSSLSQHLARLESALGLQLLDRSKNPIQLTESGRIYQNYLESNNHLYQKFRAELSDNEVQTVNIGAGTWRGSILLPDILPNFLKQHPKTQVSLHEFPVSELLTLVRNEMADFAVMNTTEAGIHEELVQKVVVQERILLVMNRNNPVAQTFLSRQAEGTIPDLRQLQNECFISLSRNLSVGKHVGNLTGIY